MGCEASKRLLEYPCVWGGMRVAARKKAFRNLPKHPCLDLPFDLPTVATVQVARSDGFSVSESIPVFGEVCV